MIDNKQVENMIYCQQDGCSDYFYQMGNHQVCPKCRLRNV